MSEYGGYMGKIGLIDLGSKSVGEYPWSDELRRKYPGGKAVASKILFDNMTGGEDPLGKDNILIFSTGPVTGLGGPSSNRFDISAISPQTGISASSNCGGNFGYYLKKAGFDALVIKGVCDTPTWIEINNGSVLFHDASELWGQTTSGAQEALQAILDRKYRRNVKCGMAVIGPAGEHLVKYSSVISGERAAGRTGMGAVLGSKKLKALTVTGNHSFRALEPEKLEKHHEYWVKLLRDNPLTGSQLPLEGTPSLLTPMQHNRQLGTKNFSQGTFDSYEKVNGAAFAETKNIVNDGCLSCPIRCSRRIKLDGKDVKGPELETLGLLSANILNDDLDLVCRWNKQLDDLGMDTISAAQTLAYAMRANEEGLWANGLAFGKTDNIAQLFDDIAHRRGIGDELAEGTKRLSKKYGGADFAMQSKGLELSAYEPRQAVGLGLGYAVSNRGGCHLNGGYVIAMEGLGLHVNPHTPHGKADLCMFMQDVLESISCNGQCLFSSYSLFPPFLVREPHSKLTKVVEGAVPYVGWAVRLLNKLPEIACFHLSTLPHTKELQYVTGMRMTLGRFIRNGERSYNIERALNAKFGVCADKDTLPKQLTHVRQDPDDPRTVVPLERMKKTYYRARGWGKDGLPGRRKLKRLGIT